MSMVISPMDNLNEAYAGLDSIFADMIIDANGGSHGTIRYGIMIGFDYWTPRIDKSKWLIVHPTANLQRERNTFRAAQLWKVIRVSDLLTLIGTFYSAGITVASPVEEK